MDASPWLPTQGIWPSIAMGKSFYDWPAPAFASHFRPGPTQVTVAAKPCQTVGPDPMGQSPSPDVQGWPQPVPIPREVPNAQGYPWLSCSLTGAVGCPQLVRPCPPMGDPELPNLTFKTVLL